VPDIVTSGNPTVAVRFPSNPWARELIRLAETPVAAPSANLFGRTSPTTAGHVREQLAGRYDALVDAGACRVGVESTVLALTGDQPVLLRPGGTTLEEIEEVVGPVRVPSPRGHTQRAQESPGMLPSHYAPRTPLSLVSDVAPYCVDAEVGIITLLPVRQSSAGPAIALSPHGDLREAAAKLYSALRSLDDLGLRRIVAERLPDRGLGRAVNDRLSRAAGG
jgi:L-threonylcarbamoyladenylate synthase